MTACYLSPGVIRASSIPSYSQGELVLQLGEYRRLIFTAITFSHEFFKTNKTLNHI